jgi:hypothetical protein
MALPASDNFNRANGALGTNWTVITGGATIDTNVAETGGVGNDSASYWNADAFNGNHSSQIKVTTLNTDANKDVGVVLRAQSGATTYYEVSVLGPAGATAVIRIRKCSAGSNTSLNSGTFTVAAGDTFKADISGSTITAYVNGVSKLTTSDGAITGGSAGIYTFVDSGTQTDAQLDDWVGDNVAAGLTAAQMAGIFSESLSGNVIGRVDA